MQRVTESFRENQQKKAKKYKLPDTMSKRQIVWPDRATIRMSIVSK